MNSPKTAVQKERRLPRCGSPRTACGPAPPFARQTVAPCATAGNHAGLPLPARPFRRVNILLLDGKVARIIGAADASRCVGHDTVPLLAVLAPCADRAVFLLRHHATEPPKQALPVAVRALPYLHTDLKSRKLMDFQQVAAVEEPAAQSPAIHPERRPSGVIAAPRACLSRRAYSSDSPGPED